MISPSQTPAGQKRRMITLAWKQRPSARSPSSSAIIVSEIIRIAANSEDDTAVHSDYGGQTVSLNYIKTKVAMLGGNPADDGSVINSSSFRQIRNCSGKIGIVD